MKVRWGNTISSSFKVGNGAKQGGIISPVLFNIHMDKLSIALVWCNALYLLHK